MGIQEVIKAMVWVWDDLEKEVVAWEEEEEAL